MVIAGPLLGHDAWIGHRSARPAAYPVAIAEIEAPTRLETFSHSF